MVDLDVLVAIRSTLFVPSAESVEDLVYHDTLVGAAFTDRNVLRPANPANIRITPTTKKKQRKRAAFNIKFQSDPRIVLITQTS